MINVHHSNPRWLQCLLERAVADGWCTLINCTTCASEQLREALGLLKKPPTGRPQFLPMSVDSAEAIIAGLRECTPQAETSHQFEEATRWVLYEVWRTFGDQYFPALSKTWSGEVLNRMRAHYQSRQESRGIHAARQGVKMRDWKE